MQQTVLIRYEYPVYEQGPGLQMTVPDINTISIVRHSTDQRFCGSFREAKCCCAGSGRSLAAEQTKLPGLWVRFGCLPDPLPY